MKLLTVQDAYERIKKIAGDCSIKSVYVWLKKGLLPSVKFGYAPMIPEAQLEIFLSNPPKSCKLLARKKAAA